MSFGILHRVALVSYDYSTGATQCNIPKDISQCYLREDIPEDKSSPALHTVYCRLGFKDENII
jgi:hypothetical protein